MNESTPPKLTVEQRQLFLEWLQWHQRMLTEELKYARKQVDTEMFADWQRSCREVEGLLRIGGSVQRVSEEVAKVFGEEQETTGKEVT